MRVSAPGVHLKRLDGRPRGGGGPDQPRGEDGGPRHQPVPGGGRRQGLPQRTQVGEDRPEGPGSGACWRLVVRPGGGDKNSVSSRVRVFFCLSKDTAELFFEDVRLPAGALLGEPNKGFYYLMNELPQVSGWPTPPRRTQRQEA